MRKCKFTDKILPSWKMPNVDDGVLIRVITATWKKNRAGATDYLDVYYEDVNGNRYTRNLYCVTMNGWCVAPPDEDFRSGWYVSDKPGIEDWDECKNFRMSFEWAGHDLTDKELGLILYRYPNFKYIYEKYKVLALKRSEAVFSDRVFWLLQIWLKHPEAEYVVSSGYTNLLFAPGFWRLKAENRKELLRWVMKNDNDKGHFYHYEGVMNLLMMKNYGVSSGFLYDMHCERVYSVKLAKYLVAQGGCDLAGTYRDYLRMCKELNKDLTDDYWRFPNDFWKAHNKVRVQVENKRRLERLAEEEKRKKESAKRLKKQMSELEKCSRPYKGLETVEGGYRLYVPNRVDDVVEQADILHQCLISCDYIDKMIKGSCVLIFIRDDEGKPVATAELQLKKENKKYSFKLNQFYADEHDRENCRPTEELQKLFYAWLNKVNCTFDFSLIRKAA